MRALVPVALAFVMTAHAGPAPTPYARDARVAYLSRAIEAVRGLGAAGRRQLQDALYTGARGRCRAALGPPAVACTLEVARAACADRAPCHLAADVILTNQRAETEVVDEPTRMRLVASATDYHTALLAELDARYAAIAAALALAEPTPITAASLPARIDRFCARAGGAPDYPRCAAALVWYIAPRMESP